MKITKRQLRRIIREELKRELITEVDTSADGGFSSKWEKVEVHMPGVGDDDGTYAYKRASNDQLDAGDLTNWLEADYLESEPTMNRIGDDIGYDEDLLAEAEEAWKKLVELGLDEWDMDDRKELASNIEAAIEEGEESEMSW